MSDDPFFIDGATLEAIRRTARRAEDGWGRRQQITDGLTALHGLVARLVAAGRALDESMHRAYREQSIREPVYIVANPRSGTTFLHRLLSSDRRFTHLKLYETLFPSVSLLNAIRGAGELDDRLGGVLQTAVDRIEEEAFAGWESIHRVAFDEPEEDEGLFVLMLLSPAVYLLCPEVADVPRPRAIDDLDGETRRQVVEYYRDSLKRILHARDAQGRFLGKTVLAPGRIRTLRRAVPDASFVHLVRHPYRAIPSFVSMFRRPWRTHSPDIEDDDPRTRRLGDLAIDYYRRMYEARDEIPDDSMTTFRFDRMVDDPLGTVEAIYDWLGLTSTDETRSRMVDRIERRRREGRDHDYSLDQFGLRRGEIYGRLKDVFEEYDFEP
ncbi:MAG: sulfotransferase [Bradymonadaceae bacterium]